MRISLPGWLEPPVFPESFERNRIARLINTMVFTGIFICLVGLSIGVPFFFSDKLVSSLLVSFFLLLCVVSWAFLRKGHLGVSAAFLVLSVHVIAILNTIANGGIESKDNLFFAAPVVLSPLLLGFRWGFVSALLAFLELTVFAFLGWWGYEIPKVMPGVPLGVWFLGLLIMALLYNAIRLSVDGWNQAVGQFQKELEEHQRTEAERDLLKDQLFQAQKMESLGRMAGGVAHDLKNLLMVVYDRLEEMKRLCPSDEALHYEIEQVNKALDRADAMAKGLLDFSKKRPLRLERIELDVLIGEIRPVLAQLLGRPIKLELDLQAPNVHVLADRIGLEQVLYNLVVNAREAMSEGGRLILRTSAPVQGSLSASQSRPFLLLTVKDEGCGMGKETREKIFEPFFTTKGKGTGLGLATVFGVVKQHSGFIEVESEVGKGAEFRIFLPQA